MPDRTSPESLAAAAWRTLSAVAPALPREQTLSKEIEDATAAQDRGYYLPDEDERLRDTYSLYLGLRTSLWETVLTLRPLLDERRNQDWGLRMRVFGLAFCATAMLMRSAGFIVSLAKDRPVVWKKLDEAEGRYGIEEKSLTGIYRNFSSARWMWRYHEAWRFYETHQKEIAEALESSGMAQVAEWLQAEEPFFEKSRREFIKRKIRYRIHAFKLRQVAGYKRVMFHLFRISGSAIADMKQPFIRRTQKAHRVSSEICLTAASKLCPGDVLVTRHDDAMSNLFLPGFWPHTSLYLGNLKQRDALGLPPIRSPETEVLEAKKDGVLFRHLTEALDVDAFFVLRPRIEDSFLREALSRAISHEGKLYDFVFDFRKADRLVCSEVIYPAYHGAGPISFELVRRSGKLVLSAQDLIQQAIDSGHFEPVCCFGIEGDSFMEGGPAALKVLQTLENG
ncbi:MAG: hypothetical protein MK312_00290 [Roseibacillus sp.]|nr:hypothetical protein [Roseibacillus sp.]